MKKKERKENKKKTITRARGRKSREYKGNIREESRKEKWRENTYGKMESGQSGKPGKECIMPMSWRVLFWCILKNTLMEAGTREVCLESLWPFRRGRRYWKRRCKMIYRNFFGLCQKPIFDEWDTDEMFSNIGIFYVTAKKVCIAIFCATYQKLLSLSDCWVI